MLAVPEISIELRPLIPFLVLTAVLCALTSVAYMAAIRKGRELSRSQWSMPQLLMSCVVVVVPLA